MGHDGARCSRSAACTPTMARIEALKGVDLDIQRGEIVALIGANGAGKSTLMMTIFGKPRAQGRPHRLDGRDITEVPTHEIAQAAASRNRPRAGASSRA